MHNTYSPCRPALYVAGTFNYIKNAAPAPPTTATAATTPPMAERTAPPVNSTTLPPGALVPVEVAVLLVLTGVGKGAAAEDAKTEGVTEAGVEDEGGATGVEEGLTGAAELEDMTGATVWPALKPAGRVMPFWDAQVAGSSPWCAVLLVKTFCRREGDG